MSVSCHLGEIILKLNDLLNSLLLNMKTQTVSKLIQSKNWSKAFKKLFKSFFQVEKSLEHRGFSHKILTNIELQPFKTSFQRKLQQSKGKTYENKPKKIFNLENRQMSKSPDMWEFLGHVYYIFVIFEKH